MVGGYPLTGSYGEGPPHQGRPPSGGEEGASAIRRGGGYPPPPDGVYPPRFAVEMKVIPLRSPSETKIRPEGGTPAPPPGGRGAGHCARDPMVGGRGVLCLPGVGGIPHGSWWGVPPLFRRRVGRELMILSENEGGKRA